MAVVSYWNERWVEIEMETPGRMRYAVSNYGRVVSFRETVRDGSLIKCGMIGGYPALSLGRKIKHSRCLHKLVAHYFLPIPPEDANTVIHYDFDKLNNNVKNLQWATKEEVLAHQNLNPQVLYGRTHKTGRKKGNKLTAAQVKRLKRAIENPNRKKTYKEIAAHYGISEMQLYRIKSGENWNHVNVPTKNR